VFKGACNNQAELVVRLGPTDRGTGKMLPFVVLRGQREIRFQLKRS